MFIEFWAILSGGSSHQSLQSFCSEDWVDEEPWRTSSKLMEELYFR
jgi:hypothetical protein